MISKGSRVLKGIYILFAMGFLLLLPACDSTVYFEKYQSIPHSAWDKNEECFFTFDVKDTTVPYNISVEIRNNNKYPYQNLWLFGGMEFPDGTIQRDTVELQLADDYGKWKGKGISVFHSSLPYSTYYHFPDTGKYTFSIRQAMRNDVLPGIQEVGVRIYNN